MKNLIIIGAGGRGREVAECIQDINQIEPEWNVLGFLSDAPKALEGFQSHHEIIDVMHGHTVRQDTYYALAINDPHAREQMAEYFAQRGARFATLVSPRAKIQSFVTIGEGSLILGNTIVLNNTRIGRFVIAAGSTIGDSATVGDFCVTNGFTNVTNVTLGKRVMVGSHAVLLNKKKIGDDAVVYAGSIVFTDVKAGTKVMGNPAMKVDF